jgi:hypothetical protein
MHLDSKSNFYFSCDGQQLISLISSCSLNWTAWSLPQALTVSGGQPKLWAEFTWRNNAPYLSFISQAVSLLFPATRIALDPVFWSVRPIRL